MAVASPVWHHPRRPGDCAIARGLAHMPGTIEQALAVGRRALDCADHPFTDQRARHRRQDKMKFTLQGKRAPILTLSWHMEDVFDTCGPLGSAHFQDHFDVQTSTVTSFGVSTRRRRRIGGRFRVVRVGARTGRVARRLGTRNSANLYKSDRTTGATCRAVVRHMVKSCHSGELTHIRARRWSWFAS